VAAVLAESVAQCGIGDPQSASPETVDSGDSATHRARSADRAQVSVAAAREPPGVDGLATVAGDPPAYLSGAPGRTGDHSTSHFVELPPWNRRSPRAVEAFSNSFGWGRPSVALAMLVTPRVQRATRAREALAAGRRGSKTPVTNR